MLVISRRPHAGFTLIELLVTMAILVILIGVGVPSFTDFMARSRASTETRELIRTIGLARSEAIARATDVKLSAVSGSDWESGFRLWVDADADDTYDAGEEIRELPGYSSNADLSVTDDTSTFTFTSEGFIEANAGTSFIFSYRTDPEHCDRDRNITLRHTGHVSVEERACP